MDKTVLDLAKDKKIADFADVVKSELKKKLLDDEFVKGKSAEIEQYQKVSNAMSSISSSETPEVEPVGTTSVETPAADIEKE